MPDPQASKPAETSTVFAAAARRAGAAGAAATDAGTDATVPSEPREDGRHARRDRNKYAVVDAFLALVREGNPQPSVADVADRSGVSHRSVFRYFNDKDELARAAVERQVVFSLPLVTLTIAPSAPLDKRIEEFVARRVQLWEALAPVARMSRSMAVTQPVIEAELRETRVFFRAQVRHLFRAEIEVLPDGERQQLLDALDMMCSFEVSDLLRRDHGRSIDETAATLRWSLAKLLAR